MTAGRVCRGLDRLHDDGVAATTTTQMMMMSLLRLLLRTVPVPTYMYYCARQTRRPSVSRGALLVWSAALVLCCFGTTCRLARSLSSSPLSSTDRPAPYPPQRSSASSASIQIAFLLILQARGIDAFIPLISYTATAKAGCGNAERWPSLRVHHQSIPPSKSIRCPYSALVPLSRI